MIQLTTAVCKGGKDLTEDFILLSALVTGSLRNIHDNKVSGQLSSNPPNHNARPDSDEDYMNMAHRLGNEGNDRSTRAASFPVKSPQSVCSPAGSEEAAKCMLLQQQVIEYSSFCRIKNKTSNV